MSKIFPAARVPLPRTLLISALLACWMPFAAIAQTGQTLIANPLLSPAKLKEIKRQILESAHKELVPPPPPALPVVPVAVPPPNMMPQFNPAMMGAGMPSMTSPSDTARNTLSKLQVMTIVGDAAILASSGAPSAGRSLPSPSGVPNGAMQLGMAMPQMQAAAGGGQDEPPQRRTASTVVRNGQRALVEGVEVMASIVGDTVQLSLMSTNALVYQGSPQPAVYSPSAVISMTLRERPNNDYVNMSKPEATSMSGTAGAVSGGQQAPQGVQSSLPVQRPVGY